MIKREIEVSLRRLARQYPVVTITGPRQSGKTTLVKRIFPNKPYVNLESPEIRQMALKDPKSFLSEYPHGAIFDEIQRSATLISYIQTIVDKNNKSGQFILTGSAQLELMQNVSQSLAGRTAILRLLPFSLSELKKGYKKEYTIDELLITGFYPRIYDKKLKASEALSFYVNTYIERDIRNLLNIKDLSRFETFLRLCAARTGQILNLSNLGNECGINHNTAASWLSMLEASYILFRLKPHYNNLSKRLVKAPKIYFYDTGLASYLLDINEVRQMKYHPLKGNIFETLVVSELLKARYNAVKESNLYYFRDNVGNEVDLILDNAGKVLPLEIKSGATFSEDMLKNLNYYLKINKNLQSKATLIYAGDKSFDYKNYRIVSVFDIFNNIRSV
jgi:uncharacterized protein